MTKFFTLKRYSPTVAHHLPSFNQYLLSALFKAWESHGSVGFCNLGRLHEGFPPPLIPSINSLPLALSSSLLLNLSLLVSKNGNPHPGDLNALLLRSSSTLSFTLKASKENLLFFLPEISVAVLGVWHRTGLLWPQGVCLNVQGKKTRRPQALEGRWGWWDCWIAMAFEDDELMAVMDCFCCCDLMSSRCKRWERVERTDLRVGCFGIVGVERAAMALAAGRKRFMMKLGDRWTPVVWNINFSDCHIRNCIGL